MIAFVRTYADLLRLADKAMVVPKDPNAILRPAALESDDDPHRLARINLARYATLEEGGSLRYWRDEWYTWKLSRGCYRKIGIEELRAKVSQSIKAEFDRINIEQQENPKGDEVPRAQKVTKALVTNVVDAMKSITIIPSSVEQMSWLSGGLRERLNYVAMRNGILNLDRLINDDDADFDDVMLPHSPDWFSTVRLPYDFDPEAVCPRWDAFLEKNLQMDPERIKRLQEWAGYLLLPDTTQQMFLALEGEGANGKSVYIAAMTAMVGIENCSSISVELLGDKFSRTQTIGKLVNICPDAGEIDKTREGDFKSFVSGDVMFFDRKNLSGLICTPTARMMMAFNTRPRWADKSNGIWRRILNVPFKFIIPEAERVKGMDQYKWWNESGELPGILLWAIGGLFRLRKQGRFTDSEVGDRAREEWRTEDNPARDFIGENLEPHHNSVLKSSALYKFYKTWADLNGYRPLGAGAFGRELSRLFTDCNRVQRGVRGDRYWCYEGIRFTQDEICGVRTAESEVY